MNACLPHTSCLYLCVLAGVVLCAVPVPPEEKCIIPECRKRRYTDGSVVHHYCSKSHADEGRKRGIFRELWFVLKLD